MCNPCKEDDCDSERHAPYFAFEGHKTVIINTSFIVGVCRYVGVSCMCELVRECECEQCACV